MKRCCTCKQYKPFSFYHKDKSTKDSLSRRCKACKSASDKRYVDSDPERKEKRAVRSKEWRYKNPERANELVREWKKKNSDRKSWLDNKSKLWTHYRMSVDQYIDLFEKQDGVCAVCKLEKRLVVDHDHACCSEKPTCGNCTRGLLCFKCNTYLHYLEEYSHLENSAKKYLDNWYNMNNERYWLWILMTRLQS